MVLVELGVSARGFEGNFGIRSLVFGKRRSIMSIVISEKISHHSGSDGLDSRDFFPSETSYDISTL